MRENPLTGYPEQLGWDEYEPSQSEMYYWDQPKPSDMSPGEWGSYLYRQNKKRKKWEGWKQLEMEFPESTNNP